MAESLADILREREVATMIENATITRRWSDVQEKVQEARRQTYVAMYECALGRITMHERDQILAILKPCCPELFI